LPEREAKWLLPPRGANLLRPCANPAGAVASLGEPLVLGTKAPRATVLLVHQFVVLPGLAPGVGVIGLQSAQ
jgi:hypothetical protein